MLTELSPGGTPLLCLILGATADWANVNQAEQEIGHNALHIDWKAVAAMAAAGISCQAGDDKAEIESIILPKINYLFLLMIVLWLIALIILYRTKHKL